jgi:tetratricopeptide (TPR) repeat protein
MIKKIGLLVFCTYWVVGCSTFSAKQKPAPVYGQVDSAQKLFGPAKVNSVKTRPVTTAQVKVDHKPIILKQEEINIVPPTQSAGVVVALLEQADTSYEQGNVNESVAIIERALRIEPRNAMLLYKLAKLRFQQSQPDLAENLAKKSELLAEGNAKLKKKNWLLIAEIRRQLGDSKGAVIAEKKARQF